MTISALVHDVRRVMPSHDPERQQMGTVLGLFDEPHQQLVWSGKLDILPMAGPYPHGTTSKDKRDAAIQEAGRDMEIFLDMTAAYAADDHSYLLAPAYTQGFSTDEIELRRNLLALAMQQQTPATGHRGSMGCHQQDADQFGIRPHAVYTDRAEHEN
ncbi:hypothetical protein ACLRGI_06270 [Paenarthrobacter nitroguajacolicus]|uniref:hypothetical protein n=1 Tax=Paenarthrobacter nitroguajacolicus TaxID=211146 RepID=UPI003ADE5C85